MSTAPRESVVVQRLLKLLRSRGAFAEKLHGDALQPTLLDILACYRGFFILLEVKRDPKLEATQRQKYTIQKVLDAGGYSAKVATEEEVLAILEKIDAAARD